MARKSDKYIHAETNRIRRVLENPDNIDKSDIDIIEELQINPRTYYIYKQKIREQDRKAWLEVAKESLESAALKVKKSLDYCTKIGKEIAANENNDARARLEAAKKVVECQMMYYKMLKEGPTVNGKSIHNIIPKPPIIPTVPIVPITNVTNRRMEPVGSDTVSTV